jgi:RNA polymerase sigma-70 factor (ECF subfamily)
MGDGHRQTEGGGVWHELHGFVYRHMRRQGVSHADAEDLAQETLEAACVHLDAVAPGKLHAWLLAVARNKLADHCRRGGRIVATADIPEVADPSPGPNDLFDASTERQAVLDAIAALPERDRQLVTLRYFEERSVIETARAVGMSSSAAKVALFRARERLRVLMEHEGGGPRG